MQVPVVRREVRVFEGLGRLIQLELRAKGSSSNLFYHSLMKSDVGRNTVFWGSERSAI